MNLQIPAPSGASGVGCKAAIRRLGVFALNHGVRMTVNNKPCYDDPRPRMGVGKGPVGQTVISQTQAQAVAYKHVLLTAMGK